MLKQMNGRAGFVLATVALVIVAVASPVTAATVYYWTTEDGTSAYTNDAKRIPAKYKESAKRRTVGKLENYPRLTRSDVKVEDAYAKRVHARLQNLRDRRPADVQAEAAGKAPIRIDIDQAGGQGGRDQVSIPVDAHGQEPIFSQAFSVRTRDSIATRTVQITQQGDKIVAVRLAEKNQRKINERMDAAATAALGKRLALPIGPN